MKSLYFKDLGIIEYGEAWELQESLMKENLSLKAESFQIKQTNVFNFKTKNHLLFCSHPHVYTIGKSGLLENLLINDQRLKELNVGFYQTNRGGDITYHGPGQIVGYPILDLEQFFTDLGKYMRCLEEVIIRVLSHLGIKGDRLNGSTGVWIEPEHPLNARKICAMGVKCSRWITIHGFALNVNTDLRYFDHIVPCGIVDKTVTSIQKELGTVIDEEEIKKLLKNEFANVFETEIC